MRFNFKALSMLLIVALIAAMLAACGAGNNNNKNGANEGTNARSNAGSNESATDENEEFKDPYELTLAVPVFGAVPADLKEVQDAINEITKEKLNTTIDIMAISVGNYAQQMNLMMSSGEKLDLAYAFGQGGYYQTQVASGKTLPMDDLLENYGQGIIEQLGMDIIEAARTRGEIHGIPLGGVYGNTPAIYMRTDLLEKHNIDVSTVKTLEDLTPIFQKIKDNEPNMYPLASGLSTPLDYYRPYDRLGDKYGILPNYDNDLQVVNLFETEEYVNTLNLLREWNQAGFINRDSATSQETSDAFVRAGQAFSYFMIYNPTTNEELNSGHKLTVVELGEPYITTDDVMRGIWTIAPQSEDPKRTMMFLNMMYSDPVVANLLAYGIEGKHYEFVDKENGVIKYPDGLDSSTVGYYMQAWMLGNLLIQYIVDSGSGTATVEDYIAYNESANRSRALGFAFNTNDVKNEITALNNVIDQYRKVLETGAVDPDEKLSEFNEKLRSAGLDKVIAEKQKQLTEWAAENNR